MNSSDPEFDMQFAFNVHSTKSTVSFRVYEEGKHKDTFIAALVVKIQKLLDSGHNGRPFVAKMYNPLTVSDN